MTIITLIMYSSECSFVQGFSFTQDVCASITPCKNSISTVPYQDNRNGRYGYQNMATAGDSSSGNLRVFIE